MKTLLTMALLFTASSVQAYTFSQFKAELKSDTRQVLGKEVVSSYRGNTLDRSQKLSVYSSLLAWKPIAVGPALLQPDSLSQSAEVAVNFPIRWWRIPIGGGLEVGDVISHTLRRGWSDHLQITFNLTANLSTGNFEFPLTVEYHF